MYAPSDFEQLLLMKASAETFNECVFLRIYIYKLLMKACAETFTRSCIRPFNKTVHAG